jgi:hypothetical protein
MLIINSASAAFLFLVLFFNNHERQAAVGALSGIGCHGGTTRRALALFGQFVRSPELRMDFPEVFRNAFLCPSVLIVQEEDRAAISAYLYMRQILDFAMRTYLILVHRSG